MATFRLDIKIVLLLALPLFSCLSEGLGIPGHPHAPGPPATIFNVLTFGAKPDGKTDNTKAFHDAWEAACQFNGRARLFIPRGDFLVGQVIFEGPCKAPIAVKLMGTVKATIDTSKFIEPEWFAFERITGFSLNGGGTFNGQGEAVWDKHDCSERVKCGSRSVNLKFRNITNAKIGRFTSLNPKGFHMCINNCHNFKAKALKITAPGTSPNTDGIHISSSTNVSISKSIISTGDDCVSIIQGDTNVYITDVVCGPGHGISVGSLGKYKNEKDVNGVFVRNCTLLNTENGVRIKTWRGSPPSAASNINFEDIIMENVKNPIIIDQEYCASGTSCRGNQASRVKISNVHFKNIRGTSVSQCAVKMKCSPEFPCKDVNMYDIDLKYVAATPNALPATRVCSNIKVGLGGIQHPPPC